MVVVKRVLMSREEFELVLSSLDVARGEWVRGAEGFSPGSCGARERYGSAGSCEDLRARLVKRWGGSELESSLAVDNFWVSGFTSEQLDSIGRQAALDSMDGL